MSDDWTARRLAVALDEFKDLALKTELKLHEIVELLEATGQEVPPNIHEALADVKGRVRSFISA